MLIDFRLAHSIQRSLNPGGIALAFAGGALSDAERSSGNEVDAGLQAWCAGRPHGIPAERRALEVSLFLTAFLAPHGVKASAMPDRLFDLQHAQGTKGIAGSERRSFCHRLAREGDRVTKFPCLGDILAAEEGKAGDRSAALQARPGRVVFGSSRGCCASRERRAGLLATGSACALSVNPG
jgi:hypothetical protein